jgi:hypothetical protein
MADAGEGIGGLGAPVGTSAPPAASTGAGHPAGGQDGPSPQRVVDRLDRALAGRRGTLISVAVLVVVAWSIAPVPANTGLEYSWKTGLSLAVDQGLVFGRDFLFTFGPLGFANDVVIVDPGLGLVSIAVAVAIHVLLVAAVVVLLRRSFTPTVALLLAVPVCMLTLVGTHRLATLAMLALVSLWALTRLATPGARCAPLEITAVGVIAGTAVVFKANAVLIVVVGCYTVAACAYATAGLRRVATDLGVFAAATGAGLLGAWIITGQPISALDEWVRGSMEVGLGYNESMGIEAGSRSRQAVEYALAGLVLVAFASMTLRSRAVGLRRRLVLLALLALVLFGRFKAGYVRHDPGHVTAFLVIAALLPLGMLKVWGRWRGLAVLGALTGALFVVADASPLRELDPARRVENLVATARLAISSERREEFVDQRRERMRRQYDLPASIVAQLAGHTVHIDPWETSIAFAYPELEWAPVPVFQSYAAYTPYLDDLNADRLVGDDRPEFVLRRPSDALDNRVVRFESPRATFELLCQYREISAVDGWQLLAAGPDRCGRPRRVARQSLHLGDPVRVPRDPDALVVAEFDGLASGPIDRLRNLAHKSRETHFAIGGRWFRFVTATQGQPHVLSVPRCAPTPGGPQADRIDEFKMVDRLGIPRLDAGEGTYEVEFLEVPYSC